LKIDSVVVKLPRKNNAGGRGGGGGERGGGRKNGKLKVFQDPKLGKFRGAEVGREKKHPKKAFTNFVWYAKRNNRMEIQGKVR